MKTKFKQFILEKKYPNDAKGYEIGEYLYHVVPEKYLENILKNGIQLSRGGTTHLNKTYEPRIYLATSLIAAYDLSVNFSAHRQEKHMIIKLDSDYIGSEYEKDESFVHGIYIDESIDEDAIIEIIDPEELVDNWSEEELENLY